MPLPPDLSRYEDLLTAREQEAWTLLARGYSNEEIARALGVTISTARSHVRGVYRVVGVRTRVVAALVWHGCVLRDPAPIKRSCSLDEVPAIAPWGLP